MFGKFYSKFVHLCDGIVQLSVHLIQLFVQVVQKKYNSNLHWIPRGCRFEPHRPHCVVSVSKTH